MKQLVQNLRTGVAQVLEVPAPRPGPNDIVVRNRASVISVGTERMVLEFSRQGLLGKARSRPDLVRQTLEKVKRDGVISAFRAARERLNEPIALGYSSAGEVIAVGEAITEFRVGDHVACGGGGFAVHAEAVRIPRTLAVRIPDPGAKAARQSVSFEEAAFATIGSVALHGLRLGSPQLGAQIAIIGLGVVGLIAVQLARAAGCRVIGLDPDISRCNLAESLGCDCAAASPEEFRALAAEMTRGGGTDVVLLCAASESSEPIHLAAEVARDRACVVSIGATGMDVPRKLFYAKELELKIARSYGPGRYDSAYEEQGRDYPLGYVRWTEGRNLQAFLDLLLQDKVRVEPLISHRFPIESAQEAYALLSNGAKKQSLGIVIEYPGENEPDPWASIPRSISATGKKQYESSVRVGLLGAGNFVKATLLAAMKNAPGTEMIAVCAASGVSAAHSAKRGGFHLATTDPELVISNPDVNTVVVATRHHWHASQVIAALRAGKHVFCEKPLCLNDEELSQIVQAYMEANRKSSQLLIIGFNRHFAPLVVELRKFLCDVREPLVMNYRVNAGFLPSSHWIQDPEQGGGRIIGEACHYIDLMSFLCGSDPVQVFATATPDSGRYRADNAILQLAFGNGSSGVITYVANGSNSFPKERLEVFAQGRTAVLDNFRRLELISNTGKKKVKSALFADKGHRSEWKALVDAVRNGRPSPIPFPQIVSTTLATFRLRDSILSGKPETVRFVPDLHGGSSAAM
jgi:predicted dehydrogenase/threonine dehydrogenase-like Zn-dependent dehydrogenase